MKVLYKRLICLFLTAMMLFALAGCNADEPNVTPSSGEMPTHTFEGGAESTNPPEDVSTPEDTSSPEESEEVSSAPIHQPGDIQSDSPWMLTYADSLLYMRNEDLVLHAIVEIENTGNEALYLGDAEFLLTDVAGEVIGEAPYVDTFPSVVAPGEKGYFFYHGSGVIGNLEVDTTYTFVPELDVRKSNTEPVRHPVSNTRLEGADSVSTFSFYGTVTNNTPETIESARCSVVFYSAEGTPITISHNFVNGLESKGEKEFMAWEWYIGMDIDASDFDSYWTFCEEVAFQW